MEVLETLKEMKRNASPEPDGFSQMVLMWSSTLLPGIG
jgi:hypothetical protein